MANETLTSLLEKAKTTRDVMEWYMFGESPRSVEKRLIQKWVSVDGLKAILESPELLEKLAELEHKQWSYWIGYLCSLENKSLLQKLSTSWYELARTPYARLTEVQKEADREFARIVLKEALGLVEMAEEKK